MKDEKDRVGLIEWSLHEIKQINQNVNNEKE